MFSAHPLASTGAWRLQDAKAKFSVLVDNALRGVPQHVTRRGKQAVVVLSEQDFEALRRGAAGRAAKDLSFIEHLLAIPKDSPTVAATAAKASQVKAPAPVRLNLRPRAVDWS